MKCLAQLPRHGDAWFESGNSFLPILAPYSFLFTGFEFSRSKVCKPCAARKRHAAFATLRFRIHPGHCKPYEWPLRRLGHSSTDPYASDTAVAISSLPGAAAINNIVSCTVVRHIIVYGLLQSMLNNYVSIS